jgi:hypothetical protein
MPMTKVQLIAYEINTFPSKAGGGKCSYKGDPDPAKDAAARVRLFEKAVVSAHGDSAWDKNKNTLKIFMAPEFYFRGTRGAYPIENQSVVISRLKNILKDPMFESWLFICGSVIVRWVGDSESTRSSGTATLVQNIVPVIRGGVDEEPRVVIKEHMSGIDFIEDGEKIRRTDFSTSDVEHPASGKPGWLWSSSGTGAGKEQQGNIRYSGLGIFDEYDLTFGVEVCLDHKEKRLRKSPPGKDQAFVQIQLIPSAGMSIRNDAVVAVKDGVVMNCDGNPRTDNDTPMSECKLVTQACGRLGTDAVTADIDPVKWIEVHSIPKCRELFADTHGVVRFYTRTSIASIVGGQKLYNKNWVLNPY